MTLDLHGDAEARYVAACERRDATRAEWEARNRPFTSEGSQGQVIPHPLVKQMNDLDALCDRLGAALRRRHDGPAPSAVIKPVADRAPVRKLRKVS